MVTKCIHSIFLENTLIGKEWRDSMRRCGAQMGKAEQEAKEKRETRTKEPKKTHFLVFNKVDSGPKPADLQGWGARKFCPEFLAPHHKTLA